ncbi:MAG TPA: hypothetical protein VH761_07920 [Ilumatobacteraceae bacterium]|jgi:hypothetical protein
MTECRICGNEIRDGEDVIEVNDALVHHDCAGPHELEHGRHIEGWSKLGATNQMTMGDVQRGDQQ